MTKDNIRNLRGKSDKTHSGTKRLLDYKEDTLSDDISSDGEDSDPPYEPNKRPRKNSSVPRKESWILGKPTIIYIISYPKHLKNILKRN